MEIKKRITNKNKIHKMRITVILVSFLSVMGLSAQNMQLDNPLPLDKRVKKGVLKNGMTYYIHKTDVVKNVASYYIIQNVGSILENDDQQGLAHFLEHMAFNGTENFKGKGILNTLEKHGLVFGKDINAYTGFDETVYNINNIPTTPELIDTGLVILRDWSNYLLLTDEEIDAERGVVKEEWRTRQNGQMRIMKRSLPTLFNNSKYAKRLPIGLMDIVENFDYKALRDFYHDWYRTDLQAIAIIGDIDVDAMEQKITALFSNIPAVKNPKERYTVDIPENEELLYSLGMDEEVTTSLINFGIRHPKSLKDKTLADLKVSLLHQMITTMLSARISEITQQPDAPFLGVRLGYGDHSRSSNAFTVKIFPKPNRQQEAFKVALTEINRAVAFGFTRAEIERTIIQFKKYYENQISKLDDIPHGRIIKTFIKNYLENNTMTDIVQEYELAKQIFEALKQSEVHQVMKDLYSGTNRFLVVTGVKGNKNLTEAEALHSIKTIEEDNTLTPYTDDFSGKTLISGIDIKAGEISSENYNEALGSTTFVLSNGIKVHYKFVDKNKNDVQLNALSHGGLSLIQDTDLPSAQLVGNVVELSGLGDYSAIDLPKILAGKTAKTKIGISNLGESISGASTTKDVETLLQMTYLRFVKPRFDKDAYQVLMENLDSYIIRRSNTINEKIKDSVTTTLYGNNNPKHRLFNSAFAKEVSFDAVKTVYLERFKNAADFEFFIIGDIQQDSLKPLLKKYVASIPTNNHTEQWQDNSVPWLSHTIDKDIPLKMEDPKSTVKIGYKADFKYSLKNTFIARALGDILQLRFTETLREEEGGTYGARAGAGMSKRPVEQASISVSFDCDPDKAERLIAIVHKEIGKMAKGDIKQTDLDKVTTNYLKERTEQQDKNSYQMRLLRNYFREGYNMNDPKNFEDIVNAISVKDIKKFAKALLKNAKSYEIVFKPKQ